MLAQRMGVGAAASHRAYGVRCYVLYNGFGYGFAHLFCARVLAICYKTLAL